MKKNILASMFVVTALLLVNSASAYKCQARDFVGSCGLLTEDDVQARLERAEVAKPDAQAVTQKFLQITMNPWRPGFECYVFDSWSFWTNEQKQKVIDRLHEQGLISLKQVENWKNSPYPPCVERK